MTHSDKRDVDPRDGHFAIGVSILLLALAVFGWGLHSKLSLYHIGARASATAPLAKLLSERERPADTAQHCDLNQGDIHAVARAASAMLIPRPVKQARVIQRRGDVPPLPPGTLARKGPALRRPPPSLVA